MAGVPFIIVSRSTVDRPALYRKTSGIEMQSGDKRLCFGRSRESPYLMATMGGWDVEGYNKVRI